jgi:hypothetical protein
MDTDESQACPGLIRETRANGMGMISNTTGLREYWCAAESIGGF